MSKLTVHYKGLVVTTCEVKPKAAGVDVENLKHGDEVTFQKSSENGKKAVFLMNVKEYDDNGNFLAEYVSSDKAARFVELFDILNSTNKDASALFLVHGFNVQPASAMNSIASKWKRFVEAGLKYYPIPVIWPCNDGGNYKEDQDDPSQKAGDQLKLFVDGIDNKLFPRKSLLMHSMGNHVVFDGSCGFKEDGTVVVCPPDVQFENIFMVAADVPHDIFWTNPWEYDNAWFNKERKKRLYGQKTAKASNFFGMLKRYDSGDKKPVGKIYVVHCPRDSALHGSSWVKNWETRLGSLGHKKDGGDKIRNEFKDYIEDYNILLEIPKFEDDSLFWHSYQLETVAIEFYFSKDVFKK